MVAPPGCCARLSAAASLSLTLGTASAACLQCYQPLQRSLLAWFPLSFPFEQAHLGHAELLKRKGQGKHLTPALAAARV